MKDFIIPTHRPGEDITDDRDLGTPARHGAPVTLTVDGVEVTVPEGTSVMRASYLAGISVPKLCASDNMEAFGSCRLCVVEIEGGAARPPPARRRWPRAWSSAPSPRRSAASAAA